MLTTINFIYDNSLNLAVQIETNSKHYVFIKISLLYQIHSKHT